MTAGGDKSVKLWNPKSQAMLMTYTGCGSELMDVVGSSDNAMILAGGRDKQPTLWDVESGKILKRWSYQGGTINSVAFNEDSSVALTASQDGTVACHDIRSRERPFQVGVALISLFQQSNSNNNDLGFRFSSRQQTVCWR